MPRPPRQTDDQLKTILSAWSTLRPDRTFGGMTLADFQAQVQPSLDARAELAELRSQTIAALNRRATADKQTIRVMHQLVSAVCGDPAEGDDSPFYDALGYVRRSERQSGLHRRKSGAAPASPAQPTESADE